MWGRRTMLACALAAVMLVPGAAWALKVVVPGVVTVNVPQVAPSTTVTTPTPPPAEVVAALPVAGPFVNLAARLVNGTLKAAGATTCPVGKTVGGAVPGAGGATITSALCALGSFGYVVHTVVPGAGPDGQARTIDTAAIIGIPSFIDANGDGRTDLLVTLTITGLLKFQFDVRKVGPTASLPVSVEAIVEDPTGGSLPRHSLAFGYDTRESSAPKVFTATVTPPTPGGSTSVDVDTTISGAGDSLALLGGLFDGTAGDRRNPMGARLAYAPVPPTSGISFTLPDTTAPAGTMLLGLRAGAPTSADARVELVQGSRTLTVQAHVQDVPASTNLAYFSRSVPDPESNVQQQLRYRASAEIPGVDVDYLDQTDGATAVHAIVRARDVPTTMQLTQNADDRAEFTVPQGALGHLEFGFARNGDPQFLQREEPYGYVSEADGVRSISGLVVGLRSFNLTAAKRFFFTARLAGESGPPLLLRVRRPDLSADASFGNLPRQISATGSFTDAGGSLTYNGFGQSIEGIDLEAHADQPLFDRIRSLAVHVSGLPARVGISYAAGSNDQELQLSAPDGVRSIELSASSSRTDLAPLPPDDSSGVIYREAGEDVSAGARLRGLQLLAVHLLPRGTVQLDTHLAGAEGQTFHVDLHKNDLTADVQTSALPARMKLRYEPDRRILFEGSETLADLRVDLHRDASLLGTDDPILASVHDAGLHIRDLPTTDIRIDVDAKHLLFDATAPVGAIEAYLSDTADHPVAPGDEDGVLATVEPDRLRAAVRILGMQRVEVSADPLRVQIAAGSGPALRVHGTYKPDAATPTATVDAVVGSLPTRLDLRQDGGWIRYDADATVQVLDLHAHDLPLSLFRHFDGQIRALPSHLDIAIDPENTGVGIDAGNQAVGDVRAEIWSDGPPLGLPPHGTTTIDVDRSAGLHARLGVVGVQRALFAKRFGDEIALHTAFVDPHPDPLAARQVSRDGTLTVSVPTPPQTLDLNLNTRLDTLLTYTASAPIGNIDIAVRLLSVEADVHLRRLPSELRFCYSGVRLGCDEQSPPTFLVDPGLFRPRERITLKHDLNAYLQTNATEPIGVDVQTCYPRDEKPGESTFRNAVGCLRESFPYHTMTIKDLRASNFRLEYASGDSDQRDSDGDPVEDGLLLLYLDTDANGVRLRSFSTHNNTYKANGDIVTKDLDIFKNESSPLRANDYWILMDVDPPPVGTEAETTDPQAYLVCDGLDIYKDGLNVVPFLPICSSGAGGG